ncbi:MAG: hypothetical protein LBI13_04390 [Streptococcaceae bacterium]|jgi:hypothetical protein|nr:hypothetical protein [Streptococcaceae bacterium]
MEKEQKVLGIIGISIGGFGLLLPWIPIINNFAFILGFVGLILGIIALIINRKNKKLLSILSLSLYRYTCSSPHHTVNFQ